MDPKTYYVYIMTNERNGTLYIGVTNNLLRRVWEHKTGQADSFTREYQTKMLVFFEETTDIYSAIQREKQLKKWNRLWKLRIIEEFNPDWKDLSLNF